MIPPPPAPISDYYRHGGRGRPPRRESPAGGWGELYREEEFLPLSGLQHFAFCRRQWALIHLEQQWQENLRTVEGQLFHERAHDAAAVGSGGAILLILRGLRGGLPLPWDCPAQCDVVEFRAAPGGRPPRGRGGPLAALSRWSTSAAAPKQHRRRPSFSCAPRPCVWRKCCAAPSRRARSITAKPAGALRCASPRSCASQVQSAAEEMHQLFRRGHTPKVQARQVLQRLFPEGAVPAAADPAGSRYADYLNRAMEETP